MRWSSKLVLGLAVLVHLGLLAGWRWQLPFVPYFFDATVLSGGRGLDFYAIYQAGHNARLGADIYEGDPARVEIAVPYFTPFRYLPVFAYTLGAALSLFDSLTAYKVWVVAVELALLGCVFITYRWVRDRDLFARLAAMWLCFSPFYLELFMGQFSFVQGALVFALMILASGNGQTPGPASPARRAWFDALWITSVLWKVNSILLAPVLIRLRRFRALGLAVALTLVTTVPYFLVYPAHLSDFLLNNLGGRVRGHELGNLGLRQLVFEVLAVAGAPASVHSLAQAAVVVGVLGAALAVTLGARVQPHMPSALALWFTVFFLISPQVWEHHYVMLLPVLVVAYAASQSAAGAAAGRRTQGWVVLLLWLLLALPTPFGFIGLQPVIAANHDLRAFPLEPAWQPLLQHSSKAVPTLVLFAYQALQLAGRAKV